MIHAAHNLQRLCACNTLSQSRHWNRISCIGGDEESGVEMGKVHKYHTRHKTITGVYTLFSIRHSSISYLYPSHQGSRQRETKVRSGHPFPEPLFKTGFHTNRSSRSNASPPSLQSGLNTKRSIQVWISRHRRDEQLAPERIEPSNRGSLSIIAFQNWLPHETDLLLLRMSLYRCSTRLPLTKQFSRL
jgi:hypothetical protein